MNTDHVKKIYEISTYTKEDLLNTHKLEKKTIKTVQDGFTKKVETGNPISENEAEFRTWKNIREVKGFRKKLRNYLKKYASEAEETFKFPEESGEKITLQEAHDQMKEFSEQKDIQAFFNTHNKKFQEQFLHKLELHVWNLARDAKRK